MLSSESKFRLMSIGILGFVFISVTAFAKKEEKQVTTNLFWGIEHIEEAEMINNNQFHVSNLTTVGDRIEIVTPSTDKK